MNMRLILICIRRQFSMMIKGYLYVWKCLAVVLLSMIISAVFYFKSIHFKQHIVKLHSKQTEASPIIRLSFRECVKELPNLDEGPIANAVEFAVRTSLQNKPNCFPVDHTGKSLPYKVVQLKVMGLICPAFNLGELSVPNALNAKTNLISNTTYNWGKLYSFSLQFHQPHEDQKDQKHSYIIFEYSENNFYTFKHTFYPQHSSYSKVGSKFNNDGSSRLTSNGGTNSNISKNLNEQFDIKPSLRVMTFNIWNVNSQPGGIDYVRRIQSLVKLCQESDADILGFQEVQFHDSKGGVLGPNQMSHFAKLLPEYQYIFQPAEIHDYGKPYLVVEGVALLSKYPIINHNNFFLKRNASNPKDTQRMLLHIEVDIPSLGKVHFFTTHLAWNLKQARQVQVVEIWEHMEQFQGPAILMGDMNADPHHKEMRFLNGDAELKGTRTKGLKDVARWKFGTDNIGHTVNQNKKLHRRLDYIFMRQHGSMDVHNITLIGKKSDKMLSASDHLGILAEFRWTKT